MCTVYALPSGLFYHLNTWLNEQKEYPYRVKQTTYIKGKVVFLGDVEDPSYENKKMHRYSV